MDQTELYYPTERTLTVASREPEIAISPPVTSTQWMSPL